ncbi:MAG TPA: cobalamin-independent methionine synthase II family protein [Chloroflexota bacterium]|nr:cobalamin-independent methionine synthase II family protein [Chloroflexota bacterium]
MAVHVPVTTTYRADVVGSLLRPPELKRAREQLDGEEMSPAVFKQIEDRAVDDAIALQGSAGLDVITDGELRRSSFYGHFVDALEGFDAQGGWGVRFRDDTGDQLLLRRPVVVDRLRRRRSMCAEEWTYLRARARRPGKVTIISTMQAASYYEPDRSQDAYPTREAYLADVVALLRQEIGELVRLGCTYIQVDGPAYGSLVDERMRQGYRERGADPDRLLDEAIELDNAVIAGYPGITFALHICRGNNQSHYYASGGYEPIARVLERTNFQRFMLEYDTDRSGGFEPLRHLPDNRIAVLGLITTKAPELESADEVKARLHEAAQYVPLERLALSTQCGFASTIEGNHVTPEDQQRKLELVARVAHEVWG